MAKHSKRTPSCRVCGCTQLDCRQCIKLTGKPCYWVEKDLCSACENPVVAATREAWQKFDENLRLQGLKVLGKIQMTEGGRKTAMQELEKGIAQAEINYNNVLGEMKRLMVERGKAVLFSPEFKALSAAIGEMNCQLSKCHQSYHFALKVLDDFGTLEAKAND